MPNVPWLLRRPLLESQFALSVAYLSQKDLPLAVGTFFNLKQCVAYDDGGHFLNVLAFVLYRECIRDAVELEDEIRLNFTAYASGSCSGLYFGRRFLPCVHGLCGRRITAQRA